MKTVLFFGKKHDEHVNKALAFCRSHFDVSAYLGVWGKPLPEDISWWIGDYIISYLSRWIIPAHLIKRANVAINFHPGSPEYPGVGCTNFALYDNVKEYGVTCHHMSATVDTGPIIAVDRFPVFNNDTVKSLLSRTYDHQLVLFYKIIGQFVTGETLPISADHWTRKPFTRLDLDNLGKISADMNREETIKRVRATTFGKWKPVVEVNGYVFEAKDGQPTDTT